MKKGALISSVAMLLVAVIAMTTASFAWFSSSLTPSVGSFDVTVTTQDALLISADFSTGFKSVLPIEDLLAKDVTATTPGRNDLLAGKDANVNVLTNATLGNSSITKAAGYAPKVATGVTGTDPFSLGFITATDSNFKPIGAETDVGKILDTNIGSYLGYDKTNAKFVTALSDGSTDMVANPALNTKYFVTFDLFFMSTLMDSTKATKLQLDVSHKATDPIDTVSTSFKMFKKSKTVAPDTEVPSTDKGYNLPKTLRIGFVASEVSAANTPAASATQVVTVYDPYSGVTVTDVTGKFPVDTTRNYKTTGFNLGNEELANQEILPKIENGKTYQVRVYVWIDGNDAESNNFVLGLDTYLKTALHFTGELVNA